MNNKTIEYRRRCLGQSPETPQQHPGKKTNDKKQKVVHATNVKVKIQKEKVKTDLNALVIKRMPL